MRSLLLFLMSFSAFGQLNSLAANLVEFEDAYRTHLHLGETERERAFSYAVNGNGGDFYYNTIHLGLNRAIRATGDTTYINDFVDIADLWMDQAETAASQNPTISGFTDNYLGWVADGTTSLTNQGGPAANYGGLYDGGGAMAWAEFAYILGKSPNLLAKVNGRKTGARTGETYQDFYDRFKPFIETHLWEKWWTRSISEIKNHTVDKSARWMQVALFMEQISTDATKLAQYREVIDEFNFAGFTSGYTGEGNMRASLYATGTNPKAWIWGRFFDNRVTSQHPQNGVTGVQDLAHGMLGVTAMINDNELGNYWTLADMDSLQNTFRVIKPDWTNGDITSGWHDGLRRDVSGSLDDRPWFDGFVNLGRFFPDLQEDMESHTINYMYDAINATGWTGGLLLNTAILTGAEKLPETNVTSTITKPTVYLNELRAFPDLEGEGANTITGGRNGVKYFITSLSNANTTPTFVPASGSVEAHYTGTYQGAMYLQQDRHIIPRVSGRVDLTEGVFPNSSTGNMSWHGHLAPEGGFLVTGDRLFPSFDNIVMRYYRHKIGNDAVTSQDDPIEFQNIDKLAFDHGSTGWGGDESLSIWNSNTGTYDEIIVQNSLIHQSRDGHNTGSIVGFTNGGSGRNTSISWHKNVYSGVTHRTPNFAGDTGSEGRIYNNIVYDWIFRLSNIVGAPRADISYNYYKTGVTNPATLASGELNKIQDIGGDRPSPPVIRSVGNIVPGILDDPLANNEVIWFNFASTTQASSSYFTSTPLSIDPVVGYEPVSAQEAYDEIFPTRDVGANRSASATGVPIIAHDAIDTYYLDAVENNTTAYLSESNWTHPTIASNSFYTDTNWNGIYDGFETEHGITASTDVIATYDFGTYQVINTAGYDAFEIFSAYMAGDFDRMEKVDVTISLGATLTRRKKQAKEYQSIILTQD